ncbi:MAG: polynucleotide adenylyltransferase PcnB [Gammaproteobacteria bacterium]|nr:polynucleotide adenylyltransferase PcnB [Gammaproteobacteria bacterium]
MTSEPPESTTAPTIIPRNQHPISRKNISDNALKVLYRLHKAGYSAYLVGGAVRDLLLDRHPKDFDITTDASPEEVKKLFGNCRLIGRRFRLAHVIYGRDVIEVATFRGAHDEEDQQTSEHGMLLRDNVYGTLAEDAWRRDFRVNALYYNIADFSLVDYTGGLADIHSKELNVIGDPRERFMHDPVRMLRAVRFAAKLGFTIDRHSEEAITSQGHLLKAIAPARLYDEGLKLFLSGNGLRSFELLRHYGLFGTLYPEVDALLNQPESDNHRTLIENAFRNSDARIAADKPVTPAFLHAALLWGVVQQQLHSEQGRYNSPVEALEQIGEQVAGRQQRYTSTPRRFVFQAREIWTMQQRLLRQQQRSAIPLLQNKRFRAAYDFLLLRAESGEPLQPLADWWTALQSADPTAQQQLFANPADNRTPRSRGPRRRKRKPAAVTAPADPSD